MTQFIDIQWPIDDLPKTCMYSVDKDEYAQFYETSNVCDCGNSEWITSAMVLNVFENQIPMSPKRFQKCSLCTKIRMSKLKDEFNEVIKLSSGLIKNLLEAIKSEEKLMYMLKNMMANLEILMIKSKNKDKKEDKILCLKNFCDEKKVDKSLILEMMKKMSSENISTHV